MVQEFSENHFKQPTKLANEQEGCEETAPARELLSQIEYELNHTETYQAMLGSLRSLPTEVAQRVHRTLKGVIREAIRTTACRVGDSLTELHGQPTLGNCAIDPMVLIASTREPATPASASSDWPGGLKADLDDDRDHRSNGLDLRLHPHDRMATPLITPIEDGWMNWPTLDQDHRVAAANATPFSPANQGAVEILALDSECGLELGGRSTEKASEEKASEEKASKEKASEEKASDRLDSSVDDLGAQAWSESLDEAIYDSLSHSVDDSSAFDSSHASNSLDSSGIDSSDEFDASLDSASFAARFARRPASTAAIAAPSSAKRKLSKTEQAALAAQTAWEARLRAISREIWQWRHAHGISLKHIHRKTQIPLHMLEALERVDMEQLPEDVYVRGFIRKIGSAIGLNGPQLADSLPPLDPLLSWKKSPRNHPQPPIGIQLRPVHLYFGYAALLVGGLSWLSHHPFPSQPHQPKMLSTPASKTAKPPKQQLPKTKVVNQKSPKSVTPVQQTKPASPKNEKVTHRIQPVASPIAIAPPETHPAAQLGRMER